MVFSSTLVPPRKFVGEMDLFVAMVGVLVAVTDGGGSGVLASDDAVSMTTTRTRENVFIMLLLLLLLLLLLCLSCLSDNKRDEKGRILLPKFDRRGCYSWCYYTVLGLWTMS
jgi:hypothetical protein